MTGLPRRVSGEAVYATLAAAAPSGVTKQDLVDATGLSANQVSLGLAWVRDIAATEHATPLTWDHRSGYRLDDNDGTWTAYERSQIRTRLDSLSRFVSGTVAPHHARIPDGEWITFLVHTLTHINDSYSVLVRRDALMK